MQLTKKERLKRRHYRVRKKVHGTAERPRLMIRKTLKHIYLIAVDDSPENGSRTVATYTTAGKAKGSKHSANIAGAVELAKVAAADLKARGFASVVYDRGGYKYHGVVKSVAEAVREQGVTI